MEGDGYVKANSPGYVDARTPTWCFSPLPTCVLGAGWWWWQRGELRQATTDLPFKVSDTSIVILKGLPVSECARCPEYLMDDEVLRRVDEKNSVWEWATGRQSYASWTSRSSRSRIISAVRPPSCPRTTSCSETGAGCGASYANIDRAAAAHPAFSWYPNFLDLTLLEKTERVLPVVNRGPT